MRTAKKCRRCSECEHSDHHWHDNSDFGDESVERPRRDYEYICKHCEALGSECHECWGTGDLEDESGPCELCGGDGVILAGALN